ncbi:MAG: helix-turn-helix domain-containing protein [Actinomycetota bacterium]|nr:helix-turn-helix domain-containing protein [Actinomycetota bacterium]
MTKLLLDVEAAVEATSLGRSKLYELMADGTIESVKVGKRRLIPADALAVFVEKLRETRAS